MTAPTRTSRTSSNAQVLGLMATVGLAAILNEYDVTLDQLITMLSQTDTANKLLDTASIQTATNKTFTSPVLTTPTIASFVNALHDHTTSAKGGKILAGGIDFTTGIWWEELGRTTLTVAGALAVSFTPKKYLHVILHSIPSTSSALSLTFNSDTGANYAVRYSDNGGASTTVVSQAAMRLHGGGSVNRTWLMDIRNIATLEKYATYIGTDAAPGAANAPESFFYAGKWANTTSQVSSIQVNTSAGNSSIGSEIIVLGHD